VHKNLWINKDVLEYFGTHNKTQGSINFEVRNVNIFVFEWTLLGPAKNPTQIQVVMRPSKELHLQEIRIGVPNCGEHMV
jgi:hypothetical protein